MLYELSGTENYLCTDLDGEVWLTAKLLYASKPPPFYTRDFKESCDAEVLDSGNLISLLTMLMMFTFTLLAECFCIIMVTNFHCDWWCLDVEYTCTMQIT